MVRVGGGAIGRQECRGRTRAHGYIAPIATNRLTAADIQATVDAVAVSPELKGHEWDLVKELRANVDSAAKGVARNTLFVVLLVAFLQLIRLGVLGENAKVGPFEVKETADVQLLVPALIAYYSFVAVSYRILLNASLEAHRRLMRALFPALYTSNLDEVLLPPGPDLQGFPQSIASPASKADSLNTVLGDALAGLLVLGTLVVEVLAFGQITAGGDVRWPVLALAILITLYFNVRIVLTIAVHWDAAALWHRFP